MKAITFVLLYITLIINTGYSQGPNRFVYGQVFGLNAQGKEPLEGAVIKVMNTQDRVLTDSKGKFSLNIKNFQDERIIVSFTGYETDTVNLNNKNYVEIILESNLTTEQIEVEDELNSIYISDGHSKTEVVTQAELKKSACCDLSGCFGKNTSIDVAVTDILTNTKELKVLGLEGAYTQILVDNLPIMTGLITKFGVTSIPGTLIDKITISKGSNSVLQGYESISGILNVLLKDYHSSERLLANGFINSGLEKQLNLNSTLKLNKWSTLFAFQTVQQGLRMDDNNDGFLDAPLTTRYMFFNKWNYGLSEDDKVNITFAAKFLDEKRIGGQKNFNIDVEKGSNSVYGQTVDLQNGDIYGRMSYMFNNENQFKFFFSGSFLNQNSYIGTTLYNAKQRNLYINTLYEFPVYKESYFRLGAGYKKQTIEENISINSTVNKTYGGDYLNDESIPGIFTETSLNLEKLNMSVIGGIRFDYHNKYNLITTPRFLLRFQLTPQTVIRASAGTGFRVANLFSEYPSFLASGKNITFDGEMKPEKMFNYGFDILQYFNFGYVSGNINIDFYRTDFRNKIIPEYGILPQTYTFSNNSEAGSNVLQAEISSVIYRNVDFRFAYKLIDIFYYKNGNKYQMPFNSKHRILTGLSYSPASKSFVVNMTLQWFGNQSLPSTINDPVQFRINDESDSYTMLNFQFTKNFKYLELYTGVENILNHKQSNPIIDYENPFSKFFDTSFVWGPVRGREFYAGFRFLLK